MVNFLRFKKHGPHGAVEPIDFLKFRWISAILSAIIFATSIGTYLYKKSTNKDGQTFNYSVDFTGGIQTLLQFGKPVSGKEIVRALDASGWKGAVTRQFSPTE